MRGNENYKEIEITGKKKYLFVTIFFVGEYLTTFFCAALLDLVEARKPWGFQDWEALTQAWKLWALDTGFKERECYGLRKKYDRLVAVAKQGSIAPLAKRALEIESQILSRGNNSHQTPRKMGRSPGHDKFKDIEMTGFLSSSLLISN